MSTDVWVQKQVLVMAWRSSARTEIREQVLGLPGEEARRHLPSVTGVNKARDIVRCRRQGTEGHQVTRWLWVRVLGGSYCVKWSEKHHRSRGGDPREGGSDQRRSQRVRNSELNEQNQIRAMGLTATVDCLAGGYALWSGQALPIWPWHRTTVLKAQGC